MKSEMVLEELEERSEWLFWSVLTNTASDIDNIKEIFNITDEEWESKKEEALFELILWEFKDSVFSLNENFSNEETNLLIDKILFLTTVIFPNHPSHSVIDILTPYILAAKEKQSVSELRRDTDPYFMDRISHLFRLDSLKWNTPKTAEQLSVKMAFGWVCAADAFSSVEIDQIKRENKDARQRFRGLIYYAIQKTKRGETPNEKVEREKWERELSELNELVSGLSKDLEEELERRVQ